MSAIYLFVINLIGLAIGPLVLAMMTDYVFDESRFGLAGIRWSLLASTCFAHLGATLLLWRGMSAFRESLDRARPSCARGTALEHALTLADEERRRLLAAGQGSGMRWVGVPVQAPPPLYQRETICPSRGECRPSSTSR